MRSRRKRLLFIAPLALLGVALFVFIGGMVVMHLWNWLTPALFGWRMLTFWQALGLLILCRILFGNFGMRGSHSSRGREVMRERMAERWQNMTPEKREKMRERWAACGFEPPPTKAEEQ
jgi:hypothetical protein